MIRIISILSISFIFPYAYCAEVADMCTSLGKKLSSISVNECISLDMQSYDRQTTNGHLIIYKEYPPLATRKPLARVLFIGGMHGDEYASFSVAIKWMNILARHHSGLFHWRIAPALNIGGLLNHPATRVNHNGVDLNRNLESRDWHELAHTYWYKETAKNLRRYPGKSPNSEIESQWIHHQIDEFKPDVIIALHAPYGLIDYDGPRNIAPPERLGSLLFKDLPTFPGSLGRYAGRDLNIPVLTIELKSARYMPSNTELRNIWVDLVRWIRLNIKGKLSY